MTTVNVSTATKLTSKKVPNGLSFRQLDNLDFVEDVVILAKEAHEESRFSYIEFAPNKVRAIVERAVSDPKRHAIMVAWEYDKPVGFTYCSIGEFHIGIGALVTTIHGVSVRKAVRHSLLSGRVAIGLFKGIETWSRARGAHEILCHVTSGVELNRTHTFIKRIGYRFIGGSYAKRIS